MKIRRKSILTGITRERDIPCSPDQYDRWKAGTLIQIAMPNLTAGEREFILSGSTDAEWDEMAEEAERAAGSPPEGETLPAAYRPDEREAEERAAAARYLAGDASVSDYLILKGRK